MKLYETKKMVEEKEYLEREKKYQVHYYLAFI
jgi:hypothetical protein